jgi:hypothetical protein
MWFHRHRASAVRAEQLYRIFLIPRSMKAARATGRTARHSDMRLQLFRREAVSRLLSVSLVLTWLCAPAEGEPTSPPARIEHADQIHALIIGIDSYKNIPKLKGAVADARDIETSLRALGVKDMTILLDESADRQSILSAIEALRAHIRPGDLVILAVAGHGAQEPEHVKGSESDGKDVVFLLAGFDTSAKATSERILDMEFKHFIKDFEAAGARVLFVADTCSGGGLAREVDPRASEIIYRAVPAYRITDDELKPVATPADAFATELDFDRTIFLAAADKNTKAPEIKVPGVDGFRGALSYAFARALEGAGDLNGDGTIVVKELFDYVHRVTYQLSDQRQNIVSASAPSLAVTTEPVIALTRAVTIVGAPLQTLDRVTTIPARLPPTKSANPLLQAPMRIAVLGGDNKKLKSVTPLETGFEIVGLSQNPELIFDARSGDVIAGGDVVARAIAPADLPGVVDRTAAVRALKQLATHSVQSIRLIPDDRLHHRGRRVEVEIGELEGRALLLLNIAGDGTVQMLYPTSSDPALPSSAEFHLPIEVREPFGADQLVAITAPERMAQLEQAVSKLSDRRSAAQVVNQLGRAGEGGIRIGTIGVFTAP